MILVRIALLSTLGLTAALCQVSETFDVASIKLTANDGSGGTYYSPQPGGGVKISGATLKSLMQYAYDIRDFQLSGTSGWMNTERFDIIAKGNGVGPGAQDYMNMTDAQRANLFKVIRTRLQALLKERFQLTVHEETKELPMYALVVAKGGVRMKSTDPEAKTGTSVVSQRKFEAKRATTDDIARGLAGQLGRPVQNETGLTGFYDFKMEWTPEPSPTSGPSDGASDPIGPSLFSALQEQLGLKLEARKGPMMVIAVEKAEKPSEN